MQSAYYKEKSVAYGMGHTRRDRILGLIPPDARRVLDIGCASGALGARIRERGAWVGGVEFSESAADVARKNLDAVWSFDISGAWPDELQQGDMDCIILAEVLEHVFDPVAVLRNVHAALRSGGCVVITTPNFLTWTNRFRFLFGAFSYQEQGMFDFGHIRWFTYDYLRSVLRSAGFVLNAERHIIFPGKLAWLVRRLPSLFAWQFVVRAHRL